MISFKIFTISISLLLLLAIGSLIRNFDLLILTIPLFSYLILILFFKKEVSIDLEIKRILEKEIVREDEELKITLEIRNKGKSIDHLYIVDSLQQGIEVVHNSNAILFSLKEGEYRIYSYFVKAGEIGKYLIGPITVFASNSDGLQIFKKVYEEYSTFKVSPKISLFGEIKFKPKYNKPWPGDAVSRTVGIGNEFFAIIESDSIDNLRRINWKATAKTGKLMKNIYNADLSSDVLLILDYRAINDIKYKNKSLLLYSSRATLLLAYRLIRDKHRVGLLVLGEELHRIKPSFGRKQFDRILYAVLDSEPGKLSDLRLLKDYVSFLFPVTTQIILISPILDYEIVLATAELAKKGYQITVISPSPFERIPFGEMDIIDKLIRIERENYLSYLKKFCNLLEWDVEKPIDVELKKASEAWLKSIRTSR